MTLIEVLNELESLGTAQNRKVYARHGVGKNMYGVSYKNLKTLQKKYSKNNPLALALWDCNIHDARVLACHIADPETFPVGALDTWCRELDNYVIANAFAALAIKTPYAMEKMTAWTAAPEEFVSQAGWEILTGLANASALHDSFFLPFLDIIESTIHTRPNRTRYSMNMALIAIGARSQALMNRALSAATVIGEVSVDHGETGCETPAAAAYIHKTVNYRKTKGNWPV